MREIIRIIAWLAIGVSAGVLVAVAVYFTVNAAASAAEWVSRRVGTVTAPAIARGILARRSIEDKLDMAWADTVHAIKRDIRRGDRPVYTPPARLAVRLPYLEAGSYAAAGAWPLELTHDHRPRLVTMASRPPAEDTAVDSNLIPQLRAMLDEAETTGAYLSRKFGGILGDLNRSLDELRRQYA